MSSVVIAGDTSGSITLQAPSIANTSTLTLPATTATLLTDSSGVLNIGSGQVYKDASGNVGIGTTNPGYLLNVSKNGSGGDSAQLARFTDTNTANSIGPLHLTIGVANHYAVSPSPVLCGTNGIALGVGDGSDLANQRRLTIDVSGNVGVGTSSPAYKLDIQGNAAGQFWASIKNTNAGASSIGGWFFGNDTYSDVGGVFAGSSGGGGFGGANSMNIGSWKSAPLAMFTNNTERMRIDSSGNLLVGTTTVSAVGSRLSIKGSAVVWGCGPTSGNDSFFVYNASSVGVYLGNGGTSWSSSSDERLKTDLIPIENGLDKVNSLRSVTGRFKTDEVGTSRSFLIAQDVQKVLPEAVSVQDDELGTLGVAYTEVIPLLVASIKELKAIIDTQQEQINSLLGK